MTTLDAIPVGQEGVEALDQIRIAGKERADSSNNTRCVDCAALEVLHNVQEAIVHVRLISKLHLDLIQIAQGIIQDGLLALALCLLLLTAHWRLLLRRCSLCRCTWAVGGEQT